MKILELNFERSWRGGERQTLYNILGFQQAGIHTELLCRKGFPLERAARDQNVVTHSFSGIFHLSLWLMVNGRNFDLLHAQTSHILTWCILTWPFHRRRIIFSRRVDFVPQGYLTRLKYRAAYRIYAVSNAVRKIVADFSGRSDILVATDIVMPQSLDEQRARAFLAAQGIEQGTRIMGTTAALVPHKDPLNMVEAIARLAKHRSDFVFLHFGDGALLAEVKEAIERHGLSHCYKLAGFVEQVTDFFSVFEVFAISSQEEGLGSSVLDAFLYKVPVAGTDAGGLSEVLAADRALQVPRRDPEALAQAIDRLLSLSPAERQEMTDKAFAYVTHFHSPAYVTAQYLKPLQKELSDLNETPKQPRK